VVQVFRNNNGLWLWVPARATLGRDDDDQETCVPKPLLIEHDDRVDRATLNRPDSLNALDPDIRAFLKKRKPVYIRR
jgi:hypothetical protein